VEREHHDYVRGLSGGRVASDRRVGRAQSKPLGRALFLVLAWAYVTGMMGSSFWGQLEETFRSDTQEPNNLLVIIVKFLLWATCVVSLVLSFKRALHSRTA
jgi:hypothetical protein